MARQTKSAPERLKRAAIDVIVDRGYGNATLIPILERVGLSKGALFHHFKSRDELTAAAYRDLLDQVMLDMTGVADELRAGKISLTTFLEKIAAIFASDASIATMEIALALRVSPTLAQLVGSNLGAWETFLERYWTSLFEVPDLDPNGQRLYWLTAMNVFRGLGVQYAFGRNAPDVQGILSCLQKTFFSEVALRG